MSSRDKSTFITCHIGNNLSVDPLLLITTQKHSYNSDQSLSSNELSHFMPPQEAKMKKKLLLLGVEESLLSRLDSSVSSGLSYLFEITPNY